MYCIFKKKTNVLFLLYFFFLQIRYMYIRLIKTALDFWLHSKLLRSICLGAMATNYGPARSRAVVTLQRL